MRRCVLMLLYALMHSASAVRFRARISYDGSRFHGLQRNQKAHDGTELRTVISTLERSLRPALDQKVSFNAASRTDAGVSATGQVVTFDAEASTTAGHDEELLVNGTAVALPALCGALNACLPADVWLTELGVVPRSFVVSRCRWKRYRYRLPPARPRADDKDALRCFRMVALHVARAASERHAEAVAEAARTQRAPPERPSKRRRRAAAAPLQITQPAVMAAAASYFEGPHDFVAFQASGDDRTGTRRTIYRCSIEPRPAAVGPAAEEDEGAGYDLVVEGDGFLYKMVRLLAGTLLMVGMGSAPAETVLAALTAADSDDARAMRRRAVVGPTLPPERLVLEHVEYDCDHEQ